METLEQRLGYHFRNQALLKQALTHPSLTHEKQRYHEDNQRLEFLGDAVLQLVITEYLYANFPKEQEGRLTKLRARSGTSPRSTDVTERRGGGPLDAAGCGVA